MEFRVRGWAFQMMPGLFYAHCTVCYIVLRKAALEAYLKPRRGMLECTPLELDTGIRYNEATGKG